MLCRQRVGVFFVFFNCIRQSKCCSKKYVKKGYIAKEQQGFIIGEYDQKEYPGDPRKRPPPTPPHGGKKAKKVRGIYRFVKMYKLKFASPVFRHNFF